MPRQCASQPGVRVAEFVLAICRRCCSYGAAVADVTAGAAPEIADAAAAAAAEAGADGAVQTAATTVVGTIVSTPSQTIPTPLPSWTHNRPTPQAIPTPTHVPNACVKCIYQSSRARQSPGSTRPPGCPCHHHHHPSGWPERLQLDHRPAGPWTEAAGELATAAPPCNPHSAKSTRFLRIPAMSAPLPSTQPAHPRPHLTLKALTQPQEEPAKAAVSTPCFRHDSGTSKATVNYNLHPINTTKSRHASRQH